MHLKMNPSPKLKTGSLKIVGARYKILAGSLPLFPKTAQVGTRPFLLGMCGSQPELDLSICQGGVRGCEVGVMVCNLILMSEQQSSDESSFVIV